MLMDHIGQIPAIAAEKFGAKEALVFEGRSFTFAEIHELVERAAGVSMVLTGLITAPSRAMA